MDSCLGFWRGVRILIVAILMSTAWPSYAVELQNLHAPISFTANAGQFDERALFQAKGKGTMLWLTSKAIYLQFIRRNEAREPIGMHAHFQPGSGLPKDVGATAVNASGTEVFLLEMTFRGAEPGVLVRGKELLDYYCNYFVGNEPKKWKSHVPNFGRVAYEDVYPGIDFELYGNDSQLEYDFLVAAGADPGLIQVQYRGAEALSIEANGDLHIKMGFGVVVQSKPALFQQVGGKRRVVSGEFRLLPDNCVGFNIGAEYSPAHPLTIDPVLTYSTYLGGTYDSGCQNIVVDALGCVYATGGTEEVDFPLLNPIDNAIILQKAYLTKFSATGNSLLFSTYFGGHGYPGAHTDMPRDIDIDNTGRAYITGWTNSFDFPMVGPFDSDYEPEFPNGADAFVISFSAAGDAIEYSTYLGGGVVDVGSGICVGDDGAAIVTGWTNSPDFPTANAFDASYNDAWVTSNYWPSDAFVTKFTADGSQVTFSTFYGTNGVDGAWDVALNDNGDVYICGQTDTVGLPVHNSKPSPYLVFHEDSTDVFVAKFSATGSSGGIHDNFNATYLHSGTVPEGMLWPWEDVAYGIDVDASGVYLTGRAGPEFPGNWWGRNGNADYPDARTFVAKMNLTLSGLLYSKVIPEARGWGWSTSYGYQGTPQVVVDPCGRAWVVSMTKSTSLPVVDPIQSELGGDGGIFDTWNVAVARVGVTGQSLVFCSYLGGSWEDQPSGLALDGSGGAYIGGMATSYDFPTVNALDSVADFSWFSGFVSKIQTEPCCQGMRGNIDGIGGIDISDLVAFVDYMFTGGPPPACMESMDVDGSDVIDIGDSIYLVDYMFTGGPEPEPCCSWGQGSY